MTGAAADAGEPDSDDPAVLKARIAARDGEIARLRANVRNGGIAGGPVLTLRIGLPQARAVCLALDTFSRLAMGRLGIVAELVRHGEVRPDREAGATPADVRRIAGEMETLMADAARCLGHRSGSHHGIGANGIPAAARRCYEVQKTVDLALAMHADPTPRFRGVDYDGVTVRYTDDPLPEAGVSWRPTASTGGLGSKAEA